ncbi:MAG: hypothetical protein P8Z68_03215 [Kineosporiaceae bacterium]|jgi:hypothetical protein
MSDPVEKIPAPRASADDEGPIPLQEAPAWHRPGVHRIRLHGKDVWVRMDARGIASMSSTGPEGLADIPVE